LWPVPGGLALALSLLAVGLLALLAIPIVLLHQACLGVDSTASPRRPARRWRAWLENPSLLGGAAALGLGIAIALPWHLVMFKIHGVPFAAALLAPPGSGEAAGTGLVPALLA